MLIQRFVFDPLLSMLSGLGFFGGRGGGGVTWDGIY